MQRLLRVVLACDSFILHRCMHPDRAKLSIGPRSNLHHHHGSPRNPGVLYVHGRVGLASVRHGCEHNILNDRLANVSPDFDIANRPGERDRLPPAQAFGCGGRYTDQFDVAPPRQIPGRSAARRTVCSSLFCDDCQRIQPCQLVTGWP